MGQYNLNRIFKPRHVAVVSASEKARTIGNALMRNLIDGGFSGMLLPVNPKYKTSTPALRPRCPWPEIWLLYPRAAPFVRRFLIWLSRSASDSVILSASAPCRTLILEI